MDKPRFVSPFTDPFKYNEWVDWQRRNNGKHHPYASQVVYSDKIQDLAYLVEVILDEIMEKAAKQEATKEDFELAKKAVIEVLNHWEKLD